MIAPPASRSTRTQLEQLAPAELPTAVRAENEAPCSSARKNNTGPGVTGNPNGITFTSKSFRRAISTSLATNKPIQLLSIHSRFTLGINAVSRRSTSQSNDYSLRSLSLLSTRRQRFGHTRRSEKTYLGVGSRRRPLLSFWALSRPMACAELATKGVSAGRRKVTLPRSHHLLGDSEGRITAHIGRPL